MRATSHVIRFEADVIRFDGTGGWHVVFLPPDAASEVRFFGRANALGAVSVTAQTGKSQVLTSLFPDKRRNSFLLPLKSALRRQEAIKEGDRITVTLLVDS